MQFSRILVQAVIAIRMHSTSTNKISGRTKKFRAYKQIIQNHFSVNPRKARAILFKNKSLLEIPKENIIKNIEICKNHNINMDEAVKDLKFLYFSEDQLENRILYMKELGAQHINTAMLLSHAAHVHINAFKAFAQIPDNFDIAKYLYSHLHDPPKNVPPMETISDKFTVREYRKKCLAHYIHWRLELSSKSDLFLYHTVQRLMNRSFTLLRQSFDVLHHDFGMPIETIKGRKCLEVCSPMDLKKILKEYPKICDISIRELLNAAPILHRMTYNKVTVIKQLLEENEFCNEQLVNFPQILLSDPNKLSQGIEVMKNTPALKVLHTHPHILKVILSTERITDRMAYLHYLNVSDATVNVLTRSVNEFDRTLRSGSNKFRGREVSLTLHKYLELDPGDIEMNLRKHPFWRQVDLLTIHSTLKYLQGLFNIKDIQKNLQILLYSRDKIQSTLMNLSEQNNAMNEDDRYSPSQLLSLCIYAIEKDYHFTGDGVWDKREHDMLLRNHTERFVAVN